MAQRREVFEDLQNALKVMNIINDQTPIPNALYAMWLLENKQLRLGVNINVRIIWFIWLWHPFYVYRVLQLSQVLLRLVSQNRCNFVIMTEALQQTFQIDVDLYWITKGFYKCALEISRDFVQLKELSYKLLEKENHTIYKWVQSIFEFSIFDTQMTHCFNDGIFRTFHRYLDENNLLDALPLEHWYGTCFAGVLTNQSLIRIWDKICGGSRKIVVFVFVTLFSWIWRQSKLPSATQVSEIITIIDNVSDTVPAMLKIFVFQFNK